MKNENVLNVVVADESSQKFVKQALGGTSMCVGSVEDLFELELYDESRSEIRFYIDQHDEINGSEAKIVGAVFVCACSYLGCTETCRLTQVLLPDDVGSWGLAAENKGDVVFKSALTTAIEFTIPSIDEMGKFQEEPAFDVANEVPY